ncbi:hypothetical protein Patl1_26206 [Pistacia atlantica]|uniref:Uncharacterized protein n=1 Tax=Pistacia atlantica TaxID=434234 RepID=A0ACC1B1L6_9ROSI|nr:hypothetical protein Patl1_26206 [Pistacia atlantica]
MGDSEGDVDNPVLKEEQMQRLVKGLRGDVTITIWKVLKLEKGLVLRAICAGFEEPTEPAVCLSGGKL